MGLVADSQILPLRRSKPDIRPGNGQSPGKRCCPKRAKNPASVLSGRGKCPKWLGVILIAFWLISLPRISVAGVFYPSVHSINITPGLTGFMVLSEGTTIFNDHSEDESVPKARVWISSIEFTPRNIVRNIFNILFGGNEGRAQQKMIPHNSQRRWLAAALISTPDTHVLDPSSQFSLVRYAVDERGVLLNDLLGKPTVKWPIGNCRSETDNSPNENIRAFQIGQRAFGDFGAFARRDPQFFCGLAQGPSEPSDGYGCDSGNQRAPLVQSGDESPRREEDYVVTTAIIGGFL